MSAETPSDIKRVPTHQEHMTEGSNSVLLPKRSKQPKHQTSLRRSKHRRARTAPQCTEHSISPYSSTSSLNNGEETNRSLCSSDQGRGGSSRPNSCHISCRVSPDKPGYFEYLRPYSVFRSPLKQTKSLPSCFTDSYHMQHPDLDNGQKTYLWHTASVYSMSNMKALQQRRYKQLLQHQVDIGFHTQEECDRYLQYLLRARKRQYMADPRVWRDPPKIPVRQKSFSVPPPLKSQSHRDYRFYPRGYEDTSKGEGDYENNKDQKKDKGEIEDSKDQMEDKGQTKDKGQDNEKSKDGDIKDPQQEFDSKSDSDEEDHLSESMQGVSLYYDCRRKTTVTRGKKEDGKSQKENEEEEKEEKISHQNCFWGSH